MIPTSRPPYSTGQLTTDQRSANRVASHSRWASNPAAVSSEGRGSSGTCVDSQARASARNSSCRAVEGEVHAAANLTHCGAECQGHGPGAMADGGMRSGGTPVSGSQWLTMPNAVIIDAVRTPVGRRGGRLSGWHAGRPGRPAAQSPARAQRPRSGPDRRRDHGVHHDGGRAGNEHRPQRRAGGRVPRLGPRHDGRSAVRVGPAGHPLRRPGGDVGCHGRRHRCGRGVDEPGAHRFDHRPGPGEAYGPLYLDASSSSTRAECAEEIARRWKISREEMDALRSARRTSGPPGPPTRAGSPTRSCPSRPGCIPTPRRSRRHRVCIDVRRGHPPRHVAWRSWRVCAPPSPRPGR